METFSEKKSGKNLQGKNYRGGCNNPLSRLRVNLITVRHQCCVMSVPFNTAETFQYLQTFYFEYNTIVVIRLVACVEE